MVQHAQRGDFFQLNRLRNPNPSPTPLDDAIELNPEEVTASYRRGYSSFEPRRPSPRSNLVLEDVPL